MTADLRQSVRAFIAAELAADRFTPCTASELDAGSVTCDLAQPVG